MNSKAKGKNGELEAAKLLREHGFKNARRSQQYAGMNGDADVVGVPGVHIEVKRSERLNIYDAIEQSIRDAKDETPIVLHRKNNKPWLVTMTFEEWVKIIKGARYAEFTSSGALEETRLDNE